MSAALDAPAVIGYVEAMTATAALGWAWLPGNAALPVELRLGTEVVASVTADMSREDLRANGVGDGRHAFSLPIPEALRARLGELRVVARTPDGGAVPLQAPPAGDGVAERLAQLARGMELLAGSQRVLHRNVQAALLAAPGGGQAGTLEGIAATQAKLTESVATLEVFVLRLDAALAGLAARPVPAQPRWALVALVGVAALALAVSVAALLRAMPA